MKTTITAVLAISVLTAAFQARAQDEISENPMIEYYTEDDQLEIGAGADMNLEESRYLVTLGYTGHDIKTKEKSRYRALEITASFGRKSGNAGGLDFMQIRIKPMSWSADTESPAFLGFLSLDNGQFFVDALPVDVFKDSELNLKSGYSVYAFNAGLRAIPDNTGLLVRFALGMLGRQQFELEQPVNGISSASGLAIGHLEAELGGQLTWGWERNMTITVVGGFAGSGGDQILRKELYGQLSATLNQTWNAFARLSRVTADADDLGKTQYSRLRVGVSLRPF